jgi:sugar phosphate isomerase/epimerase
MERIEPLPLGVFARLNREPEDVFAHVREEGFSYCQLAAPGDDYLYGAEGRRKTRRLLNAAEENGVTINSVFMTFSGQDWSAEKGPSTLGLVPDEFRAERIARACRYGSWAKEIGVEEVAAHVGFIPEDADCDCYRGFVRAMRNLALFLESQGQTFAFETGQESVAVLARTINDIGVPNLGINFDPANLLIYGLGEPAELVAKLGSLITHIHCKDAVRAATLGERGKETLLGEGDTGFAQLLRELYSQGYRQPLTIECEMNRGAEQDADIQHARAVIEKIKRELLGKCTN